MDSGQFPTVNICHIPRGGKIVIKERIVDEYKSGVHFISHAMNWIETHSYSNTYLISSETYFRVNYFFCEYMCKISKNDMQETLN